MFDIIKLQDMVVIIDMVVSNILKSMISIAKIPLINAKSDYLVSNFC